MKSIFGIGLFIVGQLIVTAQIDTHSFDQDVIESIVDFNAEEQETQQFGEELEYLRSHPIDIANPSYSELLKLPMISPLLAESIILYSDSTNIENINQLRSVSLMTDALFERIVPFITVVHSLPNVDLFDMTRTEAESRSRTEQRLQSTNGTRNGKYLGSTLSTYERTKIKSAYFEAAGLFEKDAGESYRNGLMSGYFIVKETPLFRNLVIGNFNISSAQGLVLSKNISTAKGNDAVGQTRKKGRVISPSVSTDEFRYFQGAASQFQYNNLSMTGFYSSRQLSAGLDTNGIVTSFYTSGNYRTIEDLKRHRTLGEQTIGGKIDYLFNGERNISMTLMNVQYDRFLAPSLFNLQGNRKISAGSISWEIPFSGILTFGETATNDLSRFSKVFGILFPISRKVAVSYHHRAFTKGYVSPFAHPFGERSNIADGELGNYIGIEIAEEDMTLNAYQDFFLLPSTKQDFGVIGKETFLSIALPLVPKLKVMMHFKNKVRSQADILPENDERHQSNYRFSYMYKATKEFILSQRFEMVNVAYSPSKFVEKGFLTFVEGLYKNSGSGVTIKTRFILFDTDSYDTRLYQYESDVAGNFSNPPMYGKGMRWYIVSAFEIFKNCVFSFKYLETKKQNEVVLGSGDDQIHGNLDNHIALQLDFRI